MSHTHHDTQSRPHKDPGPGFSAKWTALALMALLASCASPDAYKDSEILTHHNWWNFYERGVRHLAANNSESARQDFETALGLRSGAVFGYDKDAWLVRTYGMHYQRHYFPNRELGILLLEKGETEEAIRLLEKSIQQTPSGRAKHFLNSARSKTIPVSAAPPSIQLDHSAKADVTREARFPISGNISAEARVSTLSIQNQDRFIELAEEQISFQELVNLKEGPNVIKIRASDLLGRESSASTSVTLDRQAPVMSIRPAKTGAHRFALQVRDAHGIAQLSIDGITRFAHETGVDFPGTLTEEFELSSGEAFIEALDRAGNRLQARITAAELARLDRPAHAALAQAGGMAQAAPATSDTIRPSLKLLAGRGPITVFNEAFFLDGTAEDGGGLADVNVNGESLLETSDQGGRKTFFSRTLPLELGTNSFAISASDTAGNTSSEIIQVIRKVPEHLEETHRLTVGVPPLTGEKAAAWTTPAQRFFEQGILEEPVRFRLLEREEGWDFILREQELSLSDLADPAAALKIGKLLPAEMLLMGEVTPHEKGITVFLRVVDSASGEILFVEDVYAPDPARDLRFQLNGLALKVEQRFPLLEGIITAASGRSATLGFGTSQGAREGLQFVVLTGPEGQRQIREVDGQAVRLSIKRARAAESSAVIVNESGDPGIETGDFVYAR